MEELMLLVKPGENLPQPGKTIPIQNVIGQQVSTFKVKSIKGLRWNSSGDLVCEIKGQYVK